MRSMPKVGIVGCGFVGSTTTFTLLLEGIASEIVLINRTKKEAVGHGLDLVHGMEFLQSAKITTGSDYKLCKDCNIIIITAGAHQEVGETRLDLVNKNTKIFKEMIPQIVKHNKKAIFIVVSNPVDIMTYLTLKYSKYQKDRVIGTGTSLDTARLRYYLGSYLKVSPNSIHAYVLGEHGDSSFPVWSSATIGSINLKHFHNVTNEILNKAFEKTKNAAYEVISKKGATYYAISLTVVEIVKAIANDSNKVMPVSCMLNDYYGINNICLSVPVILNRNGINKILKVDLDKKEIENLRNSASIIKEVLSKI